MRPPIAGLTLLVILAACAPLSPNPTPLPDARDSTHASPTAATIRSPTASMAPARSPQPSNPPSAAEFQRDTVVEVVRDALLVRRGPGTTYEEVGSVRVLASGVDVAGAAYRLTTGERLVIQHGPLHLEGIDWYFVRPAALPLVGDTIFAEGWVAASEGGTASLEASTAPSGSCCFSAAGVGSGATTPVPLAAACSSPSACGRAIAWAAGLTDPRGTCQLRIMQDATGAVIVEQRIRGWAHGAEWWPEEGGAALIVETDCSWSVHVGLT